MSKQFSAAIASLAGVLLFATAAPAIAAPNPPMPTIKLGGFIRLDAQYEDRDTHDFPYPAIADTPFDDDKERGNGQFIIDSRITRFRVDVSEDLGDLQLRGRLEADFNTGDGNSLAFNSRRFRLRHSFIEAKHKSGLSFLVGQYENPLANSDVAQVSLVDFNGPAGQLYTREPQLRFGYARPLPGGIGDLRLIGAMEKNSTDDLGTERVKESQGEGQSFPLYTGKLGLYGKPVSIEAGVSAGVSQVTLVGGGRAAANTWAFATSAHVVLGPVTVFGHYHHADGLGRLAYGDFRSVVLVGRELENLVTNGWYAGATWKITDGTSVTGMVGAQHADEIKEGFTGDELEQHRSIHVNVIHKFWQHCQVGLEYRRFDIESFNGRAGTANGGLAAFWYYL